MIKFILPDSLVRHSRNRIAEAHKTVGRKDKVFAHLILEKNIGIDKRIFMTATERFYRGSSDQIVSMDESGGAGNDTKRAC